MSKPLETAENTGLLTPQDPPPYSEFNLDGKGKGILICDHASNQVPSALGHLGLDEEALSRHIAWDIGAQGVAERLSEGLDMPLIVSGYSRLVIDINRALDDFTSIREISDGEILPGNRHLTALDEANRIDELFHPYHDRLAEILAAKQAELASGGAEVPAVISVHSCTDRMRGALRPWHIGVLYSHDNRLGQAVLQDLAETNPDLVIGDNKPYSGLDAFGYSLETHAMPKGLPNVIFEVRQDLIQDEVGQHLYGDILKRSLARVLSDPMQLTLFEAVA